MKHIITAAIVAASLAVPVHAEDAPDPSVSDGFNLMEEGAKLLLRGLMNEMEPALDEMGEAMTQLGEDIGPAVSQMLALIDDIRNYEAPEVLPNGDIIIRRSEDAPLYEIDPDTGEVDL